MKRGLHDDFFIVDPRDSVYDIIAQALEASDLMANANQHTQVAVRPTSRD